MPRASKENGNWGGGVNWTSRRLTGMPVVESNATPERKERKGPRPTKPSARAKMKGGRRDAFVEACKSIAQEPWYRVLQASNHPTLKRLSAAIVLESAKLEAKAAVKL